MNKVVYFPKKFEVHNPNYIFFRTIQAQLMPNTMGYKKEICPVLKNCQKVRHFPAKIRRNKSQISIHSY